MAKEHVVCFFTTNELHRKSLSMHSGCQVWWQVQDITVRSTVSAKLTSQGANESSSEESLRIVFMQWEISLL